MELVNWYQRAVPGAASWRRWIGAALSEALLHPTTPEVWIEETHCLEQRQAMRHAVNGDSVIIGRSDSANIVINAPAIAREHARIRLSGSVYAVEDLDSKAGTYLGGRRLSPRKPERLRDGDRFTIFPYNFRLRVEQRWVREDHIDLAAGPPVPASFGNFRSSCGAARTLRGIAIEPQGTGLALDISSGLLAELARRTLHPVAAGDHVGELEEAAAEFLLLSVTERASRELVFPFQLAVLRPGHLPPIADAEEGIAVCCTMAVSQAVGVIRLFLPARALAAVRDCPAAQPRAVSRTYWRCPIVAGSIGLTVDEALALQPGDVLLYTPAPRLLLPDRRSCWRGQLTGDSNVRLTLTENQEEPLIMDDAHLDQLPVRISVMVGQRDLSFAELKQLCCGSIIELDRGPADPVGLVVNGRLSGQGEMVRIEDKLGVRVLSWQENS
jgi:type III secretion protein Q